jgi:GNAT superfamily N-acetyltransferase
MNARSFADSIRPAVPADLPAMAQIHASTDTPGLLSDLGQAFLRDVYYAGLLRSPDGHANVIEIGGEVVGFVTWSPASESLFREIFRRQLHRTAWAIAKSTARKPRIAWDFAQSVLNVERTVGADISAEVVSLEIAPAYQGLGLGFFLLQSCVAALRAGGASHIKARILLDFPSVERLYGKLGFKRGEAFRLHGRKWVLMVLDEG